MIAEDREEWDKLVAMLDSHSVGALHDPESPEWTARDVYTHLARLMEGSVRQMRAYLDGRKVEDLYAGKDEDEVNELLREEHSHMSFAEACAWAHRAFAGLIDAIESVPIDRWDEQLEFYARADGANHYRGHRSYIAIARE